MKIMRTLIVVLVACSIQACGFQLRGDYALTEQLQRVHVVAPQFSQFAQTLEQYLQSAGAELDSSAQALQIEILSDRLDRRTLSLSSSGQVAEYELIYTVQYQLNWQGVQSEVEQIEVFRDYQDDPNFALAKTREREILVAEMRDQAARQLIRQINTLLPTS